MCVIFTKDEMYGKRLLKSMTARAKQSFAIQLFTKMERLEEYLKKCGLINDGGSTPRDVPETMPDVLIADEDSYYSEISDVFTGRIVILTEERVNSKYISGMYKEDVIGIYRYQTIDSIYKQLVDNTGLIKKRGFNSTDILGVYSVANIQQRQAFVLNMAKVLSEKYKVLYINLDSFSGLEELLPQGEGGNLSDALYYYRQGKESAADKIKNTISTVEGLDYITPVKCAEDLNCMETEELIAFIDCVARSNSYEMVVLDVYNLTNDVCKILDICSPIYMPVAEDYLSKNRVQDFETYYCGIGKEDFVQRITKVRLPEGENGLCRDFWEKIKFGGMYRYVKNLLKLG